MEGLGIWRTDRFEEADVRGLETELGIESLRTSVVAEHMQRDPRQLALANFSFQGNEGTVGMTLSPALWRNADVKHVGDR